MKEDSKTLNTISLGQSLNLVRLLAGIFIISSCTLQFIYNSFLPSFIDPPSVRWAINIVVTLFFISTFVISYTPKVLDRIVLVLYAAILCYTLFLTSINNFHGSAVTLVIFVMAGGTVILTNMYLYGIQSALVLLFTIVQFTYSGYNESILIGAFNVFVSVAVYGTLLYVRLKMMEEIRFSNSILEKNNLFSIIANPTGDIIFISPSASAVLGYNTNELLKDGWWNNAQLVHAWIEKEYILNYPGAVPQEIRSIEKSVIAKDGNLVWLNWTTSLLPGGNYMGVAMDITRYRVSNETPSMPQFTISA